MSGTDIELRPGERAAHGMELAERVFTPERRTAIAQFLNIEGDDPALLPYLAVCASYGLDPIMGQVWLIPQKVTIKAKDGEPEKKVDRYKPAVGRDGYLAIARGDKRYGGMSAAVICEHDTYEVVYEGNPQTDPKILHRFASKPTVFEADEDPSRWRGRVLGAWAKCYVQGQPPVFYEATLREHGKLEQEFEWGQARGKRKWVWLKPDGTKTFENTGKPSMQWSGAWAYISAMILKAAQSYVLRIGLGITGLAPADEMRPELTEGSGIVTDVVPDGEFSFSQLPCAPKLCERLRLAVEAANELAPMSWSPAKCEMVLLGLDEDGLEREADRIEREAQLRSAAIDPPDAPITSRAGAHDEPVGQVEVEDAEIVQPVELTPEQAQLVDGLRHHQADLQSGLEAAEVGSEEHATLMSELDQVEEQIRRESAGRQEDGEPSSGE